MIQRYFVAGTDTEVGKTWVSTLLLNYAANTNKRVLGLKPVAAGADVKYGNHVENEDAVALKQASNVDIAFRDLNPFCLPDPLSPHLAAERVGTHLSVTGICQSLDRGLKLETDLTLVEGAGGWRVPINEKETMADLAIALDLPVILVVGMRLGCLNHALLSAEAILRDGLQIRGWVANELSENMLAIEENIATLKRHISAPLLLRVPFCRDSVANSSAHISYINKSFLG